MTPAPEPGRRRQKSHGRRLDIRCSLLQTCARQGLLRCHSGSRPFCKMLNLWQHLPAGLAAWAGSHPSLTVERLHYRLDIVDENTQSCLLCQIKAYLTQKPAPGAKGSADLAAYMWPLTLQTQNSAQRHGSSDRLSCTSSSTYFTKASSPVAPQHIICDVK